MKENFRDIIMLWPSVSSLADDTEGATEHVVYKWMQRKSIPSKYWESVIASARKRKITGITFKRLAAISANQSTT